MTINKRASSFWIITAVGVLAFAWMIAELTRVLSEVGSRSGFSGAFWDGVVQHKVGELMVGIPFVGILAVSNLWPEEKVRVLVRRASLIMIAGGLLNALAWYTLRDRFAAWDFLRIWCLIIFAFGLISSSLLTRMLRRMSVKP